MRTLFTSIGLTVITTTHALLNLCQKSEKRKGVLYASYEGNEVLSPIQERLPGTLLLSLNGFRKSSLLRRGNGKDALRFTNIISKPFVGIHAREEGFRRHLARFMYENQKRLLTYNSFDTAIIIDEVSTPHRMLVKAAKEERIVTIALQHGSIDNEHEGYREYKKRKPEDIADYFLVYSPFEKKCLITKSNIHDKQVIVIGSPRYDMLARSVTAKEKTAIRKKYGIGKKRYLLWVTQSHDPYFIKYEENRKNCEALFPFFARNKDLLLVIKLHPNEDQKAPLYHEFNKRYDFPARILDGKANTNELISASEGIIVKYSTTWIESVIQDKPFCRLELVKNFYAETFKDSGFDLIIKKADEVPAVIAALLSPTYRKRFSRLRSQLIKRRVANFGKATENAVNFIENIRNSSKF